MGPKALTRHLMFDGHYFGGRNPFDAELEPARRACKAIMVVIIYTIAFAIMQAANL